MLNVWQNKLVDQFLQIFTYNKLRMVIKKFTGQNLFEFSKFASIDAKKF